MKKPKRPNSFPSPCPNKASARIFFYFSLLLQERKFPQLRREKGGERPFLLFQLIKVTLFSLLYYFSVFGVFLPAGNCHQRSKQCVFDLPAFFCNFLCNLLHFSSFCAYKMESRDLFIIPLSFPPSFSFGDLKKRRRRVNDGII